MLNVLVVTLCFMTAPDDVKCGQIVISGAPMKAEQCALVAADLTKRLDIGDNPKPVALGEAKCVPTGDPA